MLEERFLKTVEETDAYRVDLVDVRSFDGWTRMFKLTLKVGGREIFVTRCHYDFELPKLVKQIDHSKGFYCNYGKGHPLDEFNDELELFAQTRQGTVPFTSMDVYADCVWIFCGNHEKYSGAFRYLIWDETLANDIRQRLGRLRQARDTAK